MRPILVALILLVFIVAALAFLRRRKPAVVATDLQVGMAGLAEEAVGMAKEDAGLILDYSVESVQQVDVVLGTLHERHQKESLSLERRRYLAIRYGAYVGEVIRRKWGGHWERDHPVGGPGALPLSSQGHESFPTAWCFKRILNGPEDNIWHKLQLLYVQPVGDDPIQRSTNSEK